MSTAQILFEQYKVLPEKIKKQLKTLIEEEETEYVDISLPAFKDAVRQVKLLKQGKLETTDAREFMKELEAELAE
jgi:polyhydroxyalkanoate synthesis regulator phasin